MYESRRTRPIHPTAFVARLARHLLAAVALLFASLLLGMAGYMSLENLSAIDAFLNAAMLLGGMGPVNAPVTSAGKIFAGGFALYAGLVFIVVAALIVTPVAHRLLHKFHWDSNP
jgi:sterol desaturase/sphingolipid hydroxylase (fatty acid hydroxylase superfamily)